MVDPSEVALRCLIVDDNALFLEGAADLLRREGLDVIGVASNGAEAIRLVSELRPDVTLVDIDLGDEDGLEVARQLSDNPAVQSKVILISTHSEEDLVDLIKESPAIGFLGKPSLSVATIRGLLETSGAAS